MPPTTTPSSSAIVRVILAGGVGSAMEWFDFGVYAYLAPTLGKVFFPASDPVAALLSSFAVFSVGYFMRPVGGVLLGRVGDRLGRRAMLMLSVVSIGVASALIGVLPTYAQAGLWAPIALVMLRCIQGISVGGEYTGAMAYTAECAPPNRRGLVSSSANVGTVAGLLAGSAAVALLQANMPASQIEAWGWRLPFLGSVLVATIGLLLRASMPESEAFEVTQRSKQTESVWRTVATHWATMLRIIAVVVACNVAFYIGFVYMPDRLSQAHTELASRANTVTSVLLASQAVWIVLGGWLSDRFGRRRISLLFTGLLIASVPIAYPLGLGQGTLLGLVVAQTILSVSVGVLTGVQGAMVAEMAPPDCRCVVYGLSYSVGIAAFAGTTPMLCEWMVGRMGWVHGPALYTLAAALVSLVVLVRLKPAQLASLD
jgi:MHS family proline/betaine transporter-like MFS transporter